VFQHKTANCFKIFQSWVCRLLKFYKIKFRMRTRAPNVNVKQFKVQKSRLNKLRKGPLMPSNKLDIVMDDESYFTLDGYCGDKGYYAYDDENVDPQVKYKRFNKFPSKLLVWIAISNRGISKPFIMKSKGAINCNNYSTECIRKRLLPILKEKHSDNNYVFWPDLASSHYGNTTIETYKKYGIKFLPREMNPPNVPQLRPIEDFWSILKQKVYSNNWSTNSCSKLANRIKLKLKEIDVHVVQRQMSKIPTKVRVAADHGADKLIH
jgi:hypothetical protein